MTVLVVEDNPRDFAFIKRGLAQNNIEDVYHAKSGEKALHIMRNEFKPCMVFLDIQMRCERIDGIQVLEEIKADRNLRDIPLK